MENSPFGIESTNYSIHLYKQIILIHRGMTEWRMNAIVIADKCNSQMIWHQRIQLRKLIFKRNNHFLLHTTQVKIAFICTKRFPAFVPPLFASKFQWNLHPIGNIDRFSYFATQKNKSKMFFPFCVASNGIIS